MRTPCVGLLMPVGMCRCMCFDYEHLDVDLWFKLCLVLGCRNRARNGVMVS